MTPGPRVARADAARASRRTRRLFAPLACGALVLAGLGGCTVGPDYAPPAAPLASRYTKEPLRQPAGAEGVRTAQGGTAAQTFAPGADLSGHWWTLFGSKALDRLVEEALANNPNLEAAQAALERSYEDVLAQRGTLYPSVSTNGQASYQKAPGGGLQSPLTNQSRFTYALFTPRLAVSYAPDLFGGAQRQIESLQARVENQRFQLEAAYLTLTTNVVLAAIQEAALREQIAMTRKVIDAQTAILDLYAKEFALGQIAQADVVQQQAALAVSQQLLAPLERQLAIQRNLLTALAGRLPNDPVAQSFTFSALRLPTRLPVSFPSDLVRQRPDVQAADAFVHQASADVGVALANRLPQFKISSDGGSSAINLTELATGPAGFYSVVGAVAQPLFDAGTLYHRQRASQDSLIEAQARYKSTVISAFQNVADSLRALQSDAQVVKAASAAEAATSKSFDLLRKERTAGAANVLQVFVSQQAYLSALTTSVQAKAAQYADTVALFQALGGGWWNRADEKPPRPDDDVFKFL